MKVTLIGTVIILTTATAGNAANLTAPKPGEPLAQGGVFPAATSSQRSGEDENANC